MTMTGRQKTGWLMVIAVSCLWAGAAPAQGIATRPANAAELEALGAPRPVKAQVFTDQTGEQVFVLRRSTGQVHDADMDEDTDRITLTAQIYARAGAGWKPAWTWTSENTCPGLDLSADFFLAQSRVLDIDGDGRAEALVASQVSCGGGVDPAAISIVLRHAGRQIEGGGESLLAIPGETPLGGTFEPGKGWTQAPKEAQRVIRETFDTVKRVP